MPCAIVSLLSLYLSFLCFGLLVQTRSRPYGLLHHPYTLAHIKGFGSPILHVYACLLLCFMLVLTSLVLAFAMLDAFRGYVVVWLHLTPRRPCLDVTTWDASLWCRLLSAYLSLFRSMRWYAYHVCLCHLLALYASLHACLHEHAWVLLASVLSMLQHNEVMDIWCKPTFVSYRHHLLFVSLLVCLFCSFACFLACLLCLSCLSALCLFHIPFASFPSIACLLVFLSLPLHVHTWNEDSWS